MPTQKKSPLDLDAALNPEQIAAVTHGDGPQLVLAGAGSGKTRVITYRIAWLVESQDVEPASIAAVTFTNKAASEMRDRVEELLGIYPLTTFVGTFHRFSLLLLRRYGDRVGLKRDFAILDTTDQLNLVKQALEIEGLDEKSYRPRSVLSAISGAKNKLMGPADYEATATNFFERRVGQLYRRYQGLLQSVSGVDFDDMISLSVRLLTEVEEVGEKVRRRIDHLLVDEYQDTNHAQLALIRAIAGGDGNLTAVGDEDQGIYRWRGAEIENILRFEKSFPGAEIRKLERNYRSTQTILDASGAVVANNEGRRGKKLWTEGDQGDPIELYRAADEGDEARWIVNSLMGLKGQYSLSDMAILVRTNAQTRALEEELLRQEVPYVLVGGTRFYDRLEIKDVVAYLRVLRNPRDSLSLLRIINTPSRGIGKTTLDMARQQAAELGIPLWDLLAQDELGDLPARSANALRGFADLIQRLRQAAEELPLPALLDQLLDESGYRAMYEDKKDAESEARLENIQELLSAAQEFTEDAGYRNDLPTDDTVTAFLDHVSLVADIDNWQSGSGVSVMTLHSAKGLEFPVVVVAGLEQGLLPHFNSQGAQEDLEEERRLFYVGMTRAKERLMITSCRRRRIAGRYQDQLDSPFLAEVPGELVAVTESPSLFMYPRASDRAGSAGSAGSAGGGAGGRGDARTGGVYSFFGDRAAGGGSGSSSSDPEPSFSTSDHRSSGSASRPAAPERNPFSARSGSDGAPKGLKRGVRVEHPILGAGRVLTLEGSGPSQKITVYFDKAGKKKLIAKYANLEVVE